MPSSAEDRFAILDVLYLYAYLADTEQWERIPSEVFAEDAVLDWGIRTMTGRKELAEWFDRERPGLLGTSHNISNEMVRVEGDSARALCKLVAWHWFDEDLGPRQQANAVLISYYEDELRRTPDGWRVYRRTAYTSPPTGLGIAPNPPDWLVQLVGSAGTRRPTW